MAYTPTSSRYDNKKWDDFEKRKDGDHDYGHKHGKKDGDHDYGHKHGKKDGDHDYGHKHDEDHGNKHAEHDWKSEKCEPIKCEPVKPPCDSNPSHPTDGIAWSHDGGYDPSDLHGALASMPATAAVDFAIDHLGGAHAPLDMAHFDGADTVHHDALA